MFAYKEYKYIVFELDDSKIVKYDLSTGETIGKLGHPVKNLNSQLKGYNLQEVIDSFEDTNYRKFLTFINTYFVNNKHDQFYNCDGKLVNRVRNIGTFLSKINNYNRFEQYFAAEIYNIDPTLTLQLNEIPKQLRKLCRKYDLHLGNVLVNVYNENPNLFNNIMSIECITLTRDTLRKMLLDDSGYYRKRSSFYKLIEHYNYNVRALIKYIDYLMTYEALDFRSTLRELEDYCTMMFRISTKYDKYPRNFLTSHQIASRNYNRLKEQFDENAFERRIDASMEWKNSNYVFIYPKTVQDIKDEAVQQNNCVTSYVKRVIDGECHILFLRKKDSIDKSLVTIEVRDDVVTQAKGKFNRDVNEAENDIIERYNKYLNRRNDLCNVNENTTELMVIC